MRNDVVKDGLPEALGELKTLRDEIRLNLHLAGMDLRDEWKEIEKRLPDGATAERMKDATKGAVQALTEEVRSFRQRLHDKKAAGTDR
jgi:hypothetical protein